MPVDDSTRRSLNLVHGSPDYTLQELGTGEINVLQLEDIPNDGYVYWLSATTKIKSGRKIPSVFVIANGGSDLVKVYWLIAEQWYASDDLLAAAALGLEKAEIFPFDWSYAIPVTNDIYHK